MSELRLQPHQQRVVNRLMANDAPHGLIAYHSTGSGKTATALAALAKALKDKNSRGLMITPASLVTNVQKERDKHSIRLNGPLDVMSYERAVRRADELQNNRYDMVVLDEAHRLRNAGTKMSRELRPLLDKSGKVLMLTGTASYNHPADMLRLVNLIDKRVHAPKTNTEFNRAYVDEVRWRLKNKKKLGDTLRRYVDLYETPKDSADFPSISRRVVNVDMSPEQMKLYRYLEQKLPLHLRGKVRNNLPMSLQESTNLNVFATGIRQASDSVMHHDVNGDPYNSPKLRMAANNMVAAARRTPGFRGMTYSNYIDAGLTPYAQMLKRRGISPYLFTGGLSAKEKRRIIDDYNTPSKDPKVLLVSSSGSEGLDLKNTRLLQVLEPHFNLAKIRQVEGRGARYKSHESLPPEQRKLLIEEYRAKFPKTWAQKLFGLRRDTAIDDYLAELAEKKQGITDEMRGLLATKH